MADIFLAYSRVDRARATAVAERLRREGWSVFMDVQMKVGERWDDALVLQLNSAKAVVVLWSVSSTRSEFVLEEADIGKKRGCLFPAIIERVKLPYGFSLIQTADLINWDSASSGHEIFGLIDALRVKLGDELSSEAVKKSKDGESNGKTLVEEARVLAQERGVDTGIVLFGFTGVFGPDWVALDLVVDGVPAHRLNLYDGGVFTVGAGYRHIKLKVIAQENGPHPPAGPSWAMGLTHSDPFYIYLEVGQIKVYRIVFKSSWLHLRPALEPLG